MFEHIEGQVSACVQWLRLLVETLGACVIAVGVTVVLAGMGCYMLARGQPSLAPVRLAFARYLTLALELQLAADILSTSIAPAWEQIGKLAAIANIRTALNYFLSLELKKEGAVDPGDGRDRNC